MPIRRQKFITGRNAPADNAKVLFVAPVWTRETLRSVSLDARIITRGAGFGGETGNAGSYPDQPPEVNPIGIRLGRADIRRSRTSQTCPPPSGFPPSRE